MSVPRRTVNPDWPGLNQDARSPALHEPHEISWLKSKGLEPAAIVAASGLIRNGALQLFPSLLPPDIRRERKLCFRPSPLIYLVVLLFPTNAIAHFLSFGA